MSTTSKANHKSYKLVRDYAEKLVGVNSSAVSEVYDHNSKVLGIRHGSRWIYLNCENADNMFVFDAALSTKLQPKLERVARMRVPARTYKSSYKGFQNKGDFPPGKSHSGIAWHFDRWHDLFDILEGKV
ncbi:MULTISPECIES: hypothetical protein [Hyphomonas]|jgi:hypothetical protein|uniref:Uncharacterized protein n=1 Tax=Hyphomonas adhaerens TaxID=81029 RepID=A0A3B9GUB8_9PROT|nr:MULTISPECIES: hypothetical protein [Hyphomonas]MBB40729.1 hypothetical protein [Hyphomonas sp.]HAE26029.1 hypothetical protein [Hyphomonas adhaerens]|tara:strand:+ start:130 stop:516 length:387 start_codon:yes stop_codon:yes gene_type:complete